MSILLLIPTFCHVSIFFCGCFAILFIWSNTTRFWVSFPMLFLFIYKFTSLSDGVVVNLLVLANTTSFINDLFQKGALLSPCFFVVLPCFRKPLTSMKSVRCNTLMKVLHLMVFFLAEIHQLATTKTQCNLYEEFVLKTFKKFTIFPRKKWKQRKNLPDLDSASIELT